ncbi:ubiquitin-activating enzyme [Plasmodium cynomolgi strain B]|uniref:Ubiquitin-activating enzyme n=1 Tax=Plasmodium cynomolgi (strain B) TaxID=1120755 RepID=K6UVW7_PLACD|nr:ubiquitin-activating enzyme [Plasmodium cynomolgi strain B]GAB67729.1 ubiquitin-activating enzyme [Plasmodium cynomolgi strain B]
MNFVSKHFCLFIFWVILHTASPSNCRISNYNTVKVDSGRLSFPVYDIFRNKENLQRGHFAVRRTKWKGSTHHLSKLCSIHVKREDNKSKNCCTSQKCLLENVASDFKNAKGGSLEGGLRDVLHGDAPKKWPQLSTHTQSPDRKKPSLCDTVSHMNYATRRAKGQATKHQVLNCDSDHPNEETRSPNGVDLLQKEKKYSRQIYTHGYEEEKKIRKSKILVIGLNGVSSEICKNLILCGVKEIGIYDNDILSVDDIDNLFFCEKKFIGKEKKSIACVQNMRKLSDNCKIEVVTNVENAVQHYDVVVSTNQSDQFNIKLSNLCRGGSVKEEKKKFICVNTVGLFGRIFVDFGQFAYSNSNSNGESYDISQVELAGDGHVVLHCLPNYRDIQLSEKDVLILRVQNGNEEVMNIPCEITDVCKRSNKIRVSILKKKNALDTIVGYVLPLRVVQYVEKKSHHLGIHLFEKLRKILQRKGGNQCVQEILLKNSPRNMSIKKVPEQVRLNYQSLEEYLNGVRGKLDRRKSCTPWSYLMSLFSRPDEGDQVSDEELCFLCYEEMIKHKKGEKIFTPKDILAFQNWCKKKKKNMNVQVVNQFCSAAHIELSPFSAFFGSLVTQEILKGVTSKFKPIHQTLFFDKRDLFPFAKITHKYHGRHMHQLNFFGPQFQKFLNSLNVLLIGSGALGCEFLKLLALMGVSSRRGISPGGRIQVVDYDLIEESNLSRQFLFSAKDVGKLKCQVASENVKKLNPNVNSGFVKMKVDESILGNRGLLLNWLFSHSRSNDQKGAHIHSSTYLEGTNGKEKIKQRLPNGRSTCPIVCILCLDNFQSRAVCDTFCVMNSIPLVEAGIEGLKGSSQIVIPFSSETYTSNSVDGQADQEANNSCTITSFPKHPNHVIQFAKSVYNHYFTDNVIKMNSFLNDPVSFIGRLCTYDNVSNLLHFFKLTKIYFNPNVHKNVQLLWNNTFVRNIIHLLKNNEAELHKYFEEVQKLPKPVSFHPENKNHLLFYQCALKIFKKFLKNLIDILASEKKQKGGVFFFKDEQVGTSKRLSFEDALREIVSKNDLRVDVKRLLYFLSVIRRNTDTEFYAAVERELFGLFNNPVFLLALRWVQRQGGKAGKEAGVGEGATARGGLAEEEVSMAASGKVNSGGSSGDSSGGSSGDSSGGSSGDNSGANSEATPPRGRKEVALLTPLICNLQDDKDDINFVFSLTNIRNENYNFSQLPMMEFFKVCNNIVPSIVTVVSAISALASLELYKLAHLMQSRGRTAQMGGSHPTGHPLGLDEPTPEDLTQFREEKLKDLTICTYGRKVYIRKKGKTLFWFFNVPYDKLEVLSSTVNNHYVNLEDNFFTHSQLSSVCPPLSYENSPSALMKRFEFSLWNYLYVDIYPRGGKRKGNGECIVGECGLSVGLFDYRGGEQQVEGKLAEASRAFREAVQKGLRGTIRSVMSGANDDAANAEKNYNLDDSAKEATNLADSILKDLHTVGTASEDEASLHQGSIHIRDIKKNVHLMTEQSRNAGEWSKTEGEKALADLVNTLKGVKKNTEQMSSHAKAFINMRRSEAKEDVTLDELVTSLEVLFSVSIQTVGVRDKIIYTKFRLPSFRHSGRKGLSVILRELFRAAGKTGADAAANAAGSTYVLHIFATDSAGREVSLPDVQVSVHHH